MKGLYESILDDEADILTRSDSVGTLMKWSEILKSTGMADLSKFKLEAGEDPEKFKLVFLGQDYECVALKFLDKSNYDKFIEACESIYLYPYNPVYLMIGFDFDFSTLPTMRDIRKQAKGYDWRNSSYNIEIHRDVKLVNLTPEFLYERKDPSIYTTLTINSPSTGAHKVSFVNFKWDVKDSKVNFDRLKIVNTPHIDLSWDRVGHLDNVTVDSKGDDMLKSIMWGSRINITGKNSGNEHVEYKNGTLYLKGDNVYAIKGYVLSMQGIKKVICDKEAGVSELNCLDVDLVQGPKWVTVMPSTKGIEFDNYNKKSDITRYNIQRKVGSTPPSCKFKAWCDLSHDKDIKLTSDWDSISGLNFVFYLGKGALDNVYCNGICLRMDGSSAIATDILSMGKKKAYIPDEEINTVIPLDHFPNLKYIIFASTCYVRTPKGWHKF